MIEDIERSLVYIETDTGNGTGFVVEEDGLVVTNEHVIEGFNTVTVVMSDGRAYEGDVLGTDEIADLAIVKLNTTEKFEAMQLGNSDDVRVGDDVIALGFPLSYELGNSLTVTKGIISSKRVYGGIEELQTDAAINPGNSGGPLMSRAGKVVGINYAELALSDGSPVDNIGFSIAINELKDRMDSLKRGEQVLLPMPTPGTWATYRNDDYGYSLEIAPGWYLDEKSDEIDRAFWHEDGTSLVEIYTDELGSDWTLEEHAQWERDFWEELAHDEAWDVFEITAFERRQDDQYDYYILAYRWQLSEEYCISDVVSLIFLSDFYPSKPYGFVINGGVCEGSLDLHSEERDAMLASFVEHNTLPAMPQPTPTPEPTKYRNAEYGYQIEVPYGWHLDEESDEGDAYFIHDSGYASVDVLTYNLGQGWTLKEHAESERDFIENHADDEWNMFEITAFAEQNDNYIMRYRAHISDEYCVEDVLTVIYLSDDYPSKPYGFAVYGGVCEEGLDIYGKERDAMLASFDP